MIVDDDVFERMGASYMFSDAGYRVLEAENADEALQLFEINSDVRLLFTDVTMPGSMSGSDLAGQVALRWPEVGHHRDVGTATTCGPPIGNEISCQALRADQRTSTCQGNDDSARVTRFMGFCGRLGIRCPLWVISGHVRCTRRCPLSAKSRHDRPHSSAFTWIKCQIAIPATTHHRQGRRASCSRCADVAFWPQRDVRTALRMSALGAHAGKIMRILLQNIHVYTSFGD